MNFLKGGLDVRGAHQDAMRVTDVKTRVGKIELLRVALAKGSGQSQYFKMIARGFQCRVCEVNPGVNRSVHRPHGPVGAVANTDFKHRLPPALGERHQQRNVPLGAVTILSELVVKVFLVGVAPDKMRAARLSVPEIANVFDCRFRARAHVPANITIKSDQSQRVFLRSVGLSARLQAGSTVWFPHLHHLAGNPGRWNRVELIARKDSKRCTRRCRSTTGPGRIQMETGRGIALRSQPESSLFEFFSSD